MCNLSVSVIYLVIKPWFINASFLQNNTMKMFQTVPKFGSAPWKQLITSNKGNAERESCACSPHIYIFFNFCNKNTQCLALCQLTVVWSHQLGYG